MAHDYYAILGTTTSADLATLRAAYLARARECHPDRGGSHAQMILLNEAWEILANPETRRDFDAKLDGKTDAAAGEAFEQDLAAARRKADDYPRDWSAFESWFEGLTNDFTKAKFDSKEVFAITWPKANESISGGLFIILGGVLGAVFAVYVVGTWFSPSDVSSIPGRAKGILALLPICLGSWIGAGLHQLIGHWLQLRSEGGAQSQRAAPTSSPSQRLVACERCGQKLRVPTIDEELSIICPKCRYGFNLKDRSASSEVPPTDSPDVVVLDRMSMGILMAIGTAIAMLGANLIVPAWFGTTAHFLVWATTGAMMGASAGLLTGCALAHELVTLGKSGTTQGSAQSRNLQLAQTFMWEVSGVGIRIGTIAGVAVIPFTAELWIMLKYPIALIVGFAAGQNMFGQIAAAWETRLASDEPGEGSR